MYIAKVIGNVVSTTKCEKLTGLKLLLVQQIDMLTMQESGTPVVVSDSVGAGVGEVVMVVTGGSARLTETTTGKPVDATTVGIIDTIEIEGRMLFEKYPQHIEIPLAEVISTAVFSSENPIEEILPEKSTHEEPTRETSPDAENPHNETLQEELHPMEALAKITENPKKKKRFNKRKV